MYIQTGILRVSGWRDLVLLCECLLLEVTDPDGTSTSLSFSLSFPVSTSFSPPVS